MQVHQRPSPNFNDRPAGVTIDSIIVHYTGKGNVEEAMDWLCSPESKVSAHYTICESGGIYQHVDTRKRAWHAGVSRWGARQEFNHFSIGIELYNPGHNRGYRAFAKPQIDALVPLMQGLSRKFPINPKLVLGHSDIAPDRKQDPGELFPWDVLVAKGLAIRP